MLYTCTCILIPTSVEIVHGTQHEWMWNVRSPHHHGYGIMDMVSWIWYHEYGIMDMVSWYHGYGIMYLVSWIRYHVSGIMDMVWWVQYHRYVSGKDTIVKGVGRERLTWCPPFFSLSKFDHPWSKNVITINNDIMYEVSWIWNHGYGIMDTASWIGHHGYGIMDTASWIRHHGYDIMDTASWIRIRKRHHCERCRS